jgi:hypothetical protein
MLLSISCHELGLIDLDLSKPETPLFQQPKKKEKRKEKRKGTSILIHENGV